NSPHVLTLGGTAVEANWPIGSQLWSYQITGGWDNTPKAMAPIEDVGGDGLADVIVCSEDGFIRCFHGNASGHGDVLWAHEIYSGPVYSGKGLDIVEDRDGDGVQEIVVGTTGGARLVRMLSGASGSELWTFQTNVIGDGGWVYQVDGSRDFTGDGIRDVIACAGDDGADSGPKRVWCLDGLTGIPLWERPVGGPAFGALAIDDMTGDGVPDVLAGASDQWEIQGAAYGIDGSTGAVQWTVETSGSSVWALAQVGDVDGDSVRDVMVGDFGSGEILILDAVYGSVLASTSVGAFLTGFQVMEDVSGDGLPDIAIEYFSNTARVLDGATCATVWSTPVADSPSVCAPIPDISGDGINDLIVGTLFSNNRGYALDGVSGAILVEMSFGTPIDSVAVMPDVVGDGSWEFLLGGRDGSVFCFSGGLDAIALDPADINQDGMVDVKDLLILLGDWGQTGSPADINGDGIVGVEDILQLLAAWNPGG
ncbi:MAG: PQQ-binding-like beta-propeller repeat protein, partial [Phycisphaerales bacterium]|nr:PQQ-binding-like beta-propeller repeat protein [Phycisphaerales bacterium]